MNKLPDIYHRAVYWGDLAPSHRNCKVITAVFLKDTLDAANNDAEFLVIGMEGASLPKGHFSKKTWCRKEILQFEFVISFM